MDPIGHWKVMLFLNRLTQTPGRGPCPSQRPASRLVSTHSGSELRSTVPAPQAGHLQGPWREQEVQGQIASLPTPEIQSALLLRVCSSVFNSN